MSAKDEETNEDQPDKEVTDMPKVDEQKEKVDEQKDESKAQEQGGQKQTNLFVSGLPEETDEQGVRELFGEHGVIISTRLYMKDGYGFVKFAEASEAEEAIKAKNGYEHKGNKLTVRFAHKDKDGKDKDKDKDKDRDKDKDKEAKGKGKGKDKGKGKYDGASEDKGSKGGKSFDGGKGGWGGGKGYQESKGASGGKGFNNWGKGGGGGYDNWGKGGYDNWGKGSGGGYDSWGKGDKGYSGGKQGGKGYPAKGGKESGGEDRPRATSKQIIEAFQSLEGNWEGNDPRGNEQWHELTFEPDMDYPENSKIHVRTWTRGKVNEQRKVIFYKDGDILYGNGQIFLDMVSTKMALWKDWYRPEMQWKWVRR